MTNKVCGATGGWSGTCVCIRQLGHPEVNESNHAHRCKHSHYFRESKYGEPTGQQNALISWRNQ